MAEPVPLRVVPAAEAPPTLEEAFRTYAGYVAGVACRILGRQSECEDVVQDVFLKAAKRLASIRDPSAIKPWLATITVRVARRRLRSRWWRDFVGTRSDDPVDRAAAPTTSPERDALLRELYRALDRLPVDERLAWSVRHIEGERLEAVALICRCSLATAKRRIAAAQARLDQELRDD